MSVTLESPYTYYLQLKCVNTLLVIKAIVKVTTLNLDLIKCRLKTVYLQVVPFILCCSANDVIIKILIFSQLSHLHVTFFYGKSKSKKFSVSFMIIFVMHLFIFGIISVCVAARPNPDCIQF